MGLPVALIGARRGGGGMGLPVSLRGGRVGAGLRPGSSGFGEGAGRAAGGVAAVAPDSSTGATAAPGSSLTTGRAGAGFGATGRAELTRRLGAASVGVSTTGCSRAGVSGTGVGAGSFVALVGLAGSSGWTSRRSPSASALRRTRSACASSIDDEWLLTPIPRPTARSTVSLFVRPSSRASS